MQSKEIQQALQRAEALVETNYKLTGEVKLLPLAVQHLQKAMEESWAGKGAKPELLKKLEALTHKKKQSPVEFVRKEKFVMCSDDYKTTIIDEKKVKALIQETKQYLEKQNA